ncbi:carbohydrate ABC transporter membrane protein 1, CUT1 family (TC 3.A.1.1.-) [Tropicimonas isoalkanivorans]|uniref:Carbohydrate ABC transporter membrane protein 1, CUT1 family (TC 3.A.1.1.-) n=1 Tax=Tropicimonas isoalkanivorans TaxID=441112 RepID=A0A1I1Q417_9RHOB|nr:carbohydrate ABC transporter membrane protein 1, CUT1 family (TC 3.A.1.1.-) [Tropicimonas isoalkanivorans]
MSSAEIAPTESGHRQSSRRFRRAQKVAPFVFLAPAVLLLLVFLLYPLVSSFRLSFVSWNGLGDGGDFVGFQNWVRLAHDTLFWRSALHNILLAVFSVVVQLPIAVVLAVVLDEASKGSRILKILYFLPLLMSSVALGVLFKNIYDPNFGPINGILSELGLYSWTQDWLGDPRLALASVIAVVSWQYIPFYMVLFLAALSSFPREITEAARLDGASGRTIFWRLKLPHLQGTFRTAALLVLIGSMRYFDLIYVMTGGGPENASEVMATYMYRTVFASFELGYGSTIASAMFFIIMAISIVSLRVSQRFETEV